VDVVQCECPLLDEKDLHLIGHTLPFYPLKVKSNTIHFICL
jgi:hypothetical protein